MQKLVNRFDGSRDPHDHIATFRQILHIEQVRDAHTQVEGFGLTLQGKSFRLFSNSESNIKSLTCTAREKISCYFLKARSKAQCGSSNLLIQTK